MPPFDTRARAFGTNAPVKKGVIGRIGTGIFDVLDASSNVVRSGMRFAQTGDVDYLTNIAANISPFHESERISGESITGGKLSGLLLEIFGDPIFFVNSFGATTKLGKALARISSLSSKRRIAQIANKADDVARFTAEIAKEKVIARSLKGRPKRSITELGIPFSKTSKLEVGDYNKVKRSISKAIPMGLLPDIRKSGLLAKAQRLTFEINQAGKAGNSRKVGELTEQLTATKEVLSGLKPGLLPLNVASNLRNIKKGFRRKFIATPENRLLQAIEEERSLATSVDLNDLKNVTSPELAKTFDDAYEAVRKTENITRVAFTSRMLALMEGRKFRELPKGSATIVNTKLENFLTFEKNIQKATDQAVKRTKKLKKIDDPILKDQRAKESIAKQEDEILGIRAEYEIKRKRLDKFVEVNGKATQTDLELVDQITDLITPMVKNAQNQRINITVYKDSVLAYVTRVVTPEMRNLKKSDKKKYNLIYNLAKQRLGFAQKRTLYPERSIPEINVLMKERFNIKYNVFEENPLTAIIARKRQDIISINKAAAVNNIVKLYGRTGIKGMKVWIKGDKTGKNFLGKMGLTGEAIGDLPKIDENLRIPNSIVEMASRTDRLIQESVFNNNTVLKFFRGLDRINRPFRVLLTSPFAAFHNRNAIGNYFLNALGGVANPKWYVGAARLLYRRRLHDKGIKIASSADQKMFKLIDDYQITLRSLYDDIYRGVDETNPQKILGILDPERPLLGTLGIPEFKGEKAVGALVPGFGSRQLGQYYEDVARIAHFTAKLDRGMLPFEAMRSVNKYLFDYSKLTNFEKQVARPSFLFYTWMRNNVPLMINSGATNPRFLSLYSKITNIGEDEAPDYLRAGSAFPIGENLFVGSLGLPIEDLNLLNVDDVDPLFFEQIKRVGQKIASRLSPVLKFGTELMTGETAFSRRPLRTMPTKDVIKELLPISRFFRVANKIIDPEEPLAFRYLDAVTGIRTYPVSTKRAKLDEAKRRAIATGKFERQGFLVIPKKEFRKGDSQVEAIKKELNKLRKRRK